MDRDMASRNAGETCAAIPNGTAPEAVPVADVNGYAPMLYRPEDAARFFAKKAGKPYRPSNGQEGDIFEDLWCANCQRDAAYRKAWETNEIPPDGCDILSDVQCLDADDPDYPREWQYSLSGQPLCLAFKAIAVILND